MRIEHIAMYVTDLEGARKFFVKYFNSVSNEGYHNPDTDFRSYFLSFDNGARLEIMNRPDILAKRDNVPQMGYAHIAFSLGSKEAVDKLTGLLRNNGYEILSEPRITGDGYYESCVVAFENNLIELTI